MSCEVCASKGLLGLSRGQNYLPLATLECSGCFGSKARRPRWRVASLRRRSSGCISDRIGRFAVGVGFKLPDTMRKASLMGLSIMRVWVLLHQNGTQYSAVEWTRVRMPVRRMSAPAPQLDTASRLRSVTRDVTFLRKFPRCRR